MPFFALSILLQILCVVHLIRNNGNKLWLTAIIFLPLAGSAAYFLFEILPGLQGNRHMRYAKKKAVEKIDPERRIRQAKENIKLTDSLANWVELADALAANGRHDEAALQYGEIVVEPHGNSDGIMFKYARSLFETGDAARAWDIMEPLEPASVNSENNQRQLLKARILSELDRDNEARDIHANIVDKIAGIEARGHYAALLLKMGEKILAKEQLEEIIEAGKRMSRAQLDEDRPIYEWAASNLKQL
ncbi:hypothetical protein GCM10009096_22980 [Parasphingorhabdus litoris]|uniref:Cardiolipin synthase N-terminal domain-containing protein n=1 Tax=Parasphingorhabdus litoris TaxID=394733 RepID=A0ABN1AMW2_9SPHN